jgi:hypothetical protein
MNQSVKGDDSPRSHLMKNVITYTGSVEIAGVSYAVRSELTRILQTTTLPVVIRIGDRKCMMIMLPAGEPIQNRTGMVAS